MIDYAPTHNTSNKTKQSPALQGFAMPGEWAPHERTWMMWPTRESVWPDMNATKKSYVDVAHAIVKFEPVTMVVSPQHEQQARNLLGPDIDIFVCEINDSWARDAGPNFLINEQGQLAGAAFSFNAWGEHYLPYAQDAQLGQHILHSLNLQKRVSQLVAEGGAITVDGEGTIITTESCLLHTNRNPGWSKKQVSDELCRLLGASKVIWLPGNDDEVETNGHVDGIAQFIRPGLVLMETSFDPEHPWYETFKENIAALEGQTDAKGRTLDICFIEDGYGCKPLNDKFCTSYINSYLVNGAVIMPKYNIAADERAAAVYRRLYPEREIVQINIDGIAVGGGGIHCITQQQPKAV